MSRYSLYGYLVDSSWFDEPSGGAKYHLKKGIGSRCGIAILNEQTYQEWGNLSDGVKCKRCTKTESQEAE